MASDKGAGVRFTWERTLTTIATAGMSAMVMFAGAQVVSSDKAIAVMQGDVVRLREAMQEMRGELRDMREKVERVQRDIGQTSRTLQQDRNRERDRSERDYAPAPYSLPAAPSSDPTFRPQTGGR